MFGLKIIKKSSYLKLLERKIQRQLASTESLRAAYIKEQCDCESLREQNKNLRSTNVKLHDANMKLKNEVKSLTQFKRDTMEALGSIDLGGFRLSIRKHKCDKCKHEQDDCTAYVFGSHAYCVTHT